MGGIFNVGLHRLNPYATVYQCHVRIVQNLPGAYTRGGGSTGVLPPNGCMVVVHIDSIVSVGMCGIDFLISVRFRFGS